MRKYNIEKPDLSIKELIQNKIDNLNKPKGSLGRLEELALQICLIQHTTSPKFAYPCHILYGADHGIEHEHVSASPREITWQQMINFSNGGGGVNMFCRQHGFKLLIVDVGVDYDLSSFHNIIDKKIARGTNNFLNEPAMTNKQFETALAVGEEMVDECHSKGCNIVCLGEMGIANTSPSSIWMSLLSDQPIEECVGTGSGINEKTKLHKTKVLSDAIQKFEKSYPHYVTEDIIRYFGGFEMVSAIGSMLRAAENKMTILIDGFIMTSCALAVSSLYPEIKEYMIFGHSGDEKGHKRMLEFMNAKPIISLGMRLGEGTGALCAFPIIDSAVRMMNEMNNFKDAHITKYF